MPRPRVFVSSTYYDLKHIRSSLEAFIETLGFDPILFENGSITYTPDERLEESCYREAAAADIFVLIVGGRYGAEAKGGESKTQHPSRENYDSITRKEFEAAVRREIPIYILIEKQVHNEYHTYLINKDNDSIRYAYVDSVNIFHMIDFIYSLYRNNPVQTFERSAEIETWLREQWAGLFRELLNDRSHRIQLSELSSEIKELKAAGNMLRSYTEKLLRSVNPSESDSLIAEESRKLKLLEREIQIHQNTWHQYMKISLPIDDVKVRQLVSDPSNFDELKRKWRSSYRASEELIELLELQPDARVHFNELRSLYDCAPIAFPRSELDH